MEAVEKINLLTPCHLTIMYKTVRQPPSLNLVHEFFKIGFIFLPKVSSDMELNVISTECLSDYAESIDQNMQSFFRANASQIADNKGWRFRDAVSIYV